ncbi:helix-turn-helix transcriptional regulator [Streptomyces sp. NPDC048172]|uniref:helix-turn-helix transcriptional regulator n=1 Tax=Streptomyces sp. NPDC048172 TaxID=3365505 RepID=UPI0037104267
MRGTCAQAVVGRDHEVGDLERALDDARSGNGQVVFLLGEEGIGKSRLARELAERAAARGMRVLRGRAAGTVGPAVPFRPLAEAMLRLFRQSAPPAGLCADVPARYGAALGRLVPDCPLAGAAGAGAEPGTGGDGDAASLVVLAEAVLRVTAAAGGEGGCLLVLEDLHAADPGTLAVVEYLADNLDAQRTMLLATLRSEPCAALDLAHAARAHGRGVLLPLNRLGRDASRALLASCLGAAPAELPEAAVDSLWQGSAGNPFLLQELLGELVRLGTLVPGADTGTGADTDSDSGTGGWRLTGDPDVSVPRALARRVAQGADRTGPRGRALFTAAALFGQRFPLPVVQRATGLDDHEALEHLKEGVARGYLEADEPAPDWYVFRHPVLPAALLAVLTPAERALRVRQLTEAIEELHPGMPGAWSRTAADLALGAGDPLGAARLLARMGGRALAEGRAAVAAGSLGRAHTLLAGVDGEAAAELRTGALEQLLDARTASGDPGGALALAEEADALCGVLPDPARAARLRAGLARAATAAGRAEEARHWLDGARSRLGHGATPARGGLDAADALLTLRSPGPGSAERAERLARGALSLAGDDTAVACEAWQALGTLSLRTAPDAANSCFDQARRLAERARLPLARLDAHLGRATAHWLVRGDTRRLEHVRREAGQLGTAPPGLGAECLLALGAVLGGRYEEAAPLVARSRARADALGLAEGRVLAPLAAAVLAGHRGQRAGAERAWAEFAERGGERTGWAPVARGLALGFGALLDEDRERAREELALATALEDRFPAALPLTGRHGLALLLDALADEGTDAGADTGADTGADAGADTGAGTSLTSPDALPPVVGDVRWNRHFALLARAVALGRAGRRAEAVAAVAEAERAGAPFPTARHLGLRLVAEAAYERRWGAPEEWLRRAEEHFHTAHVPAVAAACRALLRRTGAALPQRRRGTSQVPHALRLLGVTGREFEVFRLMGRHPGNLAIAGELFISPRTVEKHVASLLAKTGQQDRAALSAFARRQESDPGGGVPGPHE